MYASSLLNKYSTCMYVYTVKVYKTSLILDYNINLLSLLNTASSGKRQSINPTFVKFLNQTIYMYTTLR